jgi:hypothetical protein
MEGLRNETISGVNAGDFTLSLKNSLLFIFLVLKNKYRAVNGGRTEGSNLLIF